jgi:RimJ/RimL family protein N-acetyltransferase
MYVKNVNVTLRPLLVVDLMAMAERVAESGICDDASVLGLWYDNNDLPASARRMVGYHMNSWVEGDADTWRLPLGVYIDTDGGPVPIGVQGLTATEFSGSRIVVSGSWLFREWRGQGLGVKARQAIIHVAFAEIGAAEVCSQALPSNGASLGVSRSCGYEITGTKAVVEGGEEKALVTMSLSREAYVSQVRSGISSSGFDRWRQDVGLLRPED